MTEEKKRLELAEAIEKSRKEAIERCFNAIQYHRSEIALLRDEAERAKKGEETYFLKLPAILESGFASGADMASEEIAKAKRAVEQYREAVEALSALDEGEK